jgi:hypothetical protein
MIDTEKKSLSNLVSISMIQLMGKGIDVIAA